MMSQLRGVQRLEHKYIYQSLSIEDMEEKVTSCFRESYGQKICQRERRLQNMHRWSIIS